MKERIKQIRKQNGLTQVEFGKKIGVKGNTVTNYETGLRNPTDAVIKSICREFNVNEEWLRTGNGEMYKKVSDRDAEIASELLEESTPFYNLIKDITETYIKLDPKSKSALDDLIKELYNKIKKEG